MADTDTEKPLKRRAKVKARVDIPSRTPGGQLVPEGMAGRVKFVAGFGPWIRYRVRFENGEEIGTLDRDVLWHASDDAEDKSVSWLFR
jgi:hypothetical protein